MTAQDGWWTGYQWRNVSRLHADEDCAGTVRSYAYRYYPPASTSYERCVGLAWCGDCRTWSGAMVHVPRDRVLEDALADLRSEERDRLYRKERELVRYLDRLARRGLL